MMIRAQSSARAVFKSNEIFVINRHDSIRKRLGWRTRDESDIDLDGESLSSALHRWTVTRATTSIYSGTTWLCPRYSVRPHTTLVSSSAVVASNSHTTGATA